VIKGFVAVSLMLSRGNCDMAAMIRLLALT
jgi:hypothetical protein